MSRMSSTAADSRSAGPDATSGKGADLAIVTKEQILAQLGELVRKEHLGEKLLERASRAALDPREVAHLWNLSTECRDHARILNRHRREVDRSAPEIPYPSWARGQGPEPGEALELARGVFEDLAGDYRSTVGIADDLYLRKYLAILADEHDRLAMQLIGMSEGLPFFEDFSEEATEE